MATPYHLFIFSLKMFKIKALTQAFYKAIGIRIKEKTEVVDVHIYRPFVSGAAAKTEKSTSKMMEMETVYDLRAKTIESIGKEKVTSEDDISVDKASGKITKLGSESMAYVIGDKEKALVDSILVGIRAVIGRCLDLYHHSFQAFILALILIPDPFLTSRWLHEHIQHAPQLFNVVCKRDLCAQLLFDGMPVRDMVHWNVMMKCPSSLGSVKSVSRSFGLKSSTSSRVTAMAAYKVKLINLDRIENEFEAPDDVYILDAAENAWSGFSWLVFAHLYSFVKLSLASTIMLFLEFGTMKLIGANQLQTKANKYSKLSIIDLLCDDEPNPTVEKSLTCEDHVSFSLEGLGKVGIETPVHSPEQKARIPYRNSPLLKDGRKSKLKNLNHVLDDIELEVDQNIAEGWLFALLG
ncbi:TIP49, C-terminal [Sesbania bispinosa]|nr:TIP49, C-terminal [Sesbania bispinosa]